MNYSRPIFLFNPHLETIYPALFRRVNLPLYHRERISTPDDDFLDLDWLKQKSKKLIIISHGLEGNTQRAYMKGMAKAGFQKGYDILTWNYRGCSEEMNKRKGFYHSGATDDLNSVINHAHSLGQYKSIFLVGFSLGGNLTLKYLGEGRAIPQTIKKVITFSVPLDLHASCNKISSPSNWVYSQRFLKSLREKVIRKSKSIDGFDLLTLAKIKTLREFDDHFTGPIHGFKDALDYYHQCSAIRFLDSIQISTLVINAANDPFLSPECYPSAHLKDHTYISFESPQYGGHVGFAQFSKNGLYWSEQRAMDFFES